MRLHGTGPPEHFELWVETEKSLQKILLGPEPEVLQHGIARVIRWEKDVVHVDDNAWLQARQNLEVFTKYVAAYSDDVAGVDEKNVVAFERVKKFEIDVLHRGRDLQYTVTPEIVCEALRIGIHRNELAVD